MGFALPGVGVARSSFEAERDLKAGWLLFAEIELYDGQEVPRLAKAARKAVRQHCDTPKEAMLRYFRGERLRTMKAGRTFRWIVASALLLVLSLPLAAQTLTGPARVIDGDTIELQGQKVRLHGVDAPELSQTCQRKGALYHCGAVALVRLEELIDGRPVTSVAP